jgi:hypothetical protein
MTPNIFRGMMRAVLGGLVGASVSGIIFVFTVARCSVTVCPPGPSALLLLSIWSLPIIGLLLGFFAQQPQIFKLFKVIFGIFAAIGFATIAYLLLF